MDKTLTSTRTSLVLRIKYLIQKPHGCNDSTNNSTNRSKKPQISLSIVFDYFDVKWRYFVEEENTRETSTPSWIDVSQMFRDTVLISLNARPVLEFH
jgi:hypothetical protein